MPVKRLTEPTIKALKAEPGAVQTDYIDQLQPNFGIRVGQPRNGRPAVKTFWVCYIHGGKKRRHKIGRWPIWPLTNARKRARDLLRSAQMGENPRGPSRRTTFEDALSDYVKYIKSRKRSWEKIKRLIEKDALPVWGRRCVRDITAEDAKQLLDAVEKRGLQLRIKVYGALGGLFRWAKSEKLVDENPCAGLGGDKKPKARTRVLDDSEIRELWRVTEQDGSPMAKLFQTILLTGQRPGEVRQMQWQQLRQWEEGEEGWWYIPDSIVKTDVPHRAYVTPLLRQILQSLNGLDRHWVFPAPVKKGCVPSLGDASIRYRKRLGFDFRPNDLRRSCATGMARLKISPLYVSLVLGHSVHGTAGGESGSSMTRAVYNQYHYEDEIRDAHLAWSRHLEQITHSHVLPFRRSG